MREIERDRETVIKGMREIKRDDTLFFLFYSFDPCKQQSP
jgi:hypothetical protein